MALDDDDDQNGFIPSTSTSIQNMNCSLCERAKTTLTSLLKAEHDVDLKKDNNNNNKKKNMEPKLSMYMFKRE